MVFSPFQTRVNVHHELLSSICYWKDSGELRIGNLRVDYCWLYEVFYIYWGGIPFCCWLLTAEGLVNSVVGLEV